MAKAFRKSAESGTRTSDAKSRRTGGRTAKATLSPKIMTYAMLKRGVSASELKALIEFGRIRRSDVQMVIPARTLERRLSGGQTLKIDEADAIARIVRVRDHTRRVFESEDVAEEWLNLPNPALDGELPIEMARTDIGAREVEAVLGRIEHGVYG